MAEPVNAESCAQRQLGVSESMAVQTALQSHLGVAESFNGQTFPQTQLGVAESLNTRPCEQIQLGINESTNAQSCSQTQVGMTEAINVQSCGQRQLGVAETINAQACVQLGMTVSLNALPCGQRPLRVAETANLQVCGQNQLGMAEAVNVQACAQNQLAVSESINSELGTKRKLEKNPTVNAQPVTKRQTRMSKAKNAEQLAKKAVAESQSAEPPTKTQAGGVTPKNAELSGKKQSAKSKSKNPDSPEREQDEGDESEKTEQPAKKTGKATPKAPKSRVKKQPGAPDSTIKVARNLFQKNKKGEILESSARKILLYTFTRLIEENPKSNMQTIADRAAELTGVSSGTLFRIKSEARLGVLKTPGQTRPNAQGKRGRLTKYDNFTLQTIRRGVHSFYKRDEIPTVKKILSYLNNNPEILPQKISEKTLSRLLNDIGFSFKKVKKQFAVIEKDDIVVSRRKYLRAIKLNKEMNKMIYYLNETWVNAGISASKMWENKIKPYNDTQNADTSIETDALNGKGRIIVIVAGSERGIIYDTVDIFNSKKSKDNPDDIDSNHFESWFKYKLLPNLTPNSIIVMDNSPYHSVKEERHPTKSWNKKAIQDWLTSKSIPWSTDLLKLELLSIVSKEKHKFEEYRIDRIASEAGHKVLRLPLYHCELNPLELIWVQVKSYVAHKNENPEPYNVQNLLHEGLDKVTAEDWENAISHVAKFEQEYWETDRRMEEVLEENQPTIQLSGPVATQESEQQFYSWY